MSEENVVLDTDGAIDSSAIAAKVASRLVNDTLGDGDPAAKLEPADEPTTTKLEHLDSVDPMEVSDPAAEPAEGDEPVAVEPVVQEPVSDLTDEVYDELLSYGIDLGVPPSDVAPELKESYTLMAESVIRIATEARNSQLEAQETQMQVQDFMKRLETNPNDIMMLIALNQPEKFQAAIEAFERIQSDPREKQLMEKELELRARDEQIKRQQSVHQASQSSQRATRVRTQIQRACTTYGVDPAVAESWVVNEVRSKGDISPTRINEIIRQLKPATARTPADQLKVQQTPTQPTGGTPGAGTIAPEVKEPSPGLQHRSVSTIRDAIKGAIRNNR